MKNRYEICGDVTKIYIDSPKYGEKVVLIDTEDLPRVKPYSSWQISHATKDKTLYAITTVRKQNKRRTSRTMQRVIMDAINSTKVVDFIDHNTLNIQKKNLRLLTASEDGQNKLTAQQNNQSSGIRGVTYDKGHKKWAAYLSLNKKRYYLGRYPTKSEAARAAADARRKLMPYSEMDKEASAK